jgi:hypothetical protein
MSHIGTSPPSGVGRRRPERRIGDPEADLLAFHVAARLQRGRLLVGAEPGQGGVARLLGGDRTDQERDEDHEHGGEHRPALARIAHHAAEGVAERRGDRQDREQLEEVGQGRRILEGMRRVDVEEPAAVGTELLDGDLACGGSERHGLFRHRGLLHHPDAVGGGHGLALGVDCRCLHREWLEQRDRAIRCGALYDALAQEHDGQQRRWRQQHVERGAREVDPEVPDPVGLVTRDAACQCDQHRDAGRRGEEVLHAKAERLRQIAKRRLATITLPVRVRREADGGVER